MPSEPEPIRSDPSRAGGLNGWLTRALILALLSGLAGVATAGWVAVRQTQLDTAQGAVRIGTLEDRVSRIEQSLDTIRRDVADLRASQERIAADLKWMRDRLEEALHGR